MKKTGCDRTPNPIFVRHAGGLKSISTDSIVYMEANACKSFFYLNDGSVVQVEMPLNMALRKMSKIAKTILRIHRSYAVNIEYINMYYNDCFIMHTGKSIPICRECDAYHCRRCVKLNKDLTLEINTPGHQQCVMSHVERRVSKNILDAIREYGDFAPNISIPDLDYNDPFYKIINKTR